jgi:hypothetical protein
LSATLLFSVWYKGRFQKAVVFSIVPDQAGFSKKDFQRRTVVAVLTDIDSWYKANASLEN